MAVSIETSKRSFDGTYCDIAANGNGDIVCVYHKSNVWNDAYYKTGKLTERREVQWFQGRDMQVCKAKYPRVAINDDKIAVMVYTISGLLRTSITYRIGIPAKDNLLNWEKEQKFQYGDNPSIAVSGNKVLIVYTTRNKKMHYSFGRIDAANKRINWNMENQELKADAAYPSVAMQEDHAVVLYRESALLDSMFIDGYYLKSIVGDINNDTVTWKTVQDDSEGKEREDQFVGEYPNVSMFGDGIVVSTHQKGKMAGRHLFARSGKIDSESGEIVWHEKAGNFMYGAESSVAAVSSGNDHIFIEMHTTNGFGIERLYYHVGEVSNIPI